ncbi:outer membrane lipoprotein carrier protein LolA [Novosphingobium sp. KCTC 2891]|uniref:LolA family protein n=1 Tax=Novosphingobium sp. KCTC 2891 TaxID=2989730 RepID=UPI002222213F|nr:outer membrane lipoprotein carrier protein LolA [Novosphingobium sp. KCTC 2891]MCW1382035.1 outer membrane lipoprotein carrier protein LolA [Novosphingobium sp. KCTC 2891]
MNTILKSLRTAALAGSALALAATGLAAFPQAVSAQSARSPQVDQAVSALRAISTMRADFVQTDRNGQRIGGTMTLKRPGKIRFQYQKGVPFLIVSDGAALTMIDYEVRQVQRWPIRNSPLGALLDPNKDVARFATLNPTAHPDVLSVNVKDPRHPEYGTITMVMTRNAAAPGGWQLDSWVALDSQAKRTTIRLSNQQYGVDVPDNTFRWTDPRPQIRH